MDEFSNQIDNATVFMMEKQFIPLPGGACPGVEHGACCVVGMSGIQCIHGFE